MRHATTHAASKVPLPVTFMLGHAAAAAIVVAASASTAATAKATTGLMGKDPRSGRIHAANLVAWWPYHLGLRTKLWIQWRKNKGKGGEPLYNKVTPNLWVLLLVVLRLVVVGGWIGCSSQGLFSVHERDTRGLSTD